MNVDVYDPFVDEAIIKKFGGVKVDNLDNSLKSDLSQYTCPSTKKLKI